MDAWDGREFDLLEINGDFQLPGVVKIGFSPTSPVPGNATEVSIENLGPALLEARLNWSGIPSTEKTTYRIDPRTTKKITISSPRQVKIMWRRV